MCVFFGVELQALCLARERERGLVGVIIVPLSRDDPMITYPFRLAHVAGARVIARVGLHHLIQPAHVGVQLHGSRWK